MIPAGAELGGGGGGGGGGGFLGLQPPKTFPKRIRIAHGGRPAPARPSKPYKLTLRARSQCKHLHRVRQSSIKKNIRLRTCREIGRDQHRGTVPSLLLSSKVTKCTKFILVDTQVTFLCPFNKLRLIPKWMFHHQVLILSLAHQPRHSQIYREL